MLKKNRVTRCFIIVRVKGLREFYRFASAMHGCEEVFMHARFLTQNGLHYFSDNSEIVSISSGGCAGERDLYIEITTKAFCTSDLGDLAGRGTVKFYGVVRCLLFSGVCGLREF